VGSRSGRLDSNQRDRPHVRMATPPRRAGLSPTDLRGRQGRAGDAHAPLTPGGGRLPPAGGAAPSSGNPRVLRGGSPLALPRGSLSRSALASPTTPSGVGSAGRSPSRSRRGRSPLKTRRTARRADESASPRGGLVESSRQGRRRRGAVGKADGSLGMMVGATGFEPARSPARSDGHAAKARGLESDRPPRSARTRGRRARAPHSRRGPSAPSYAVASRSALAPATSPPGRWSNPVAGGAIEKEPSAKPTAP